MTQREPVATKNLDGYGNPELPWSRARDALAKATGADITWFLGTVPARREAACRRPRRDLRGRRAVLRRGPGARKARNLAANDACTLSVHLPGLDLVFQGHAERVTDRETLHALPAKYQREGWPARSRGRIYGPVHAPSGGPPPWHLYRLRYDTVYGVAGEEPHGATRWRFSALGSVVPVHGRVSARIRVSCAGHSRTRPSASPGS